jgi:hypothetical protein
MHTHKHTRTKWVISETCMATHAQQQKLGALTSLSFSICCRDMVKSSLPFVPSKGVQSERTSTDDTLNNKQPHAQLRRAFCVIYISQICYDAFHKYVGCFALGKYVGAMKVPPSTSQFSVPGATHAIYFVQALTNEDIYLMWPCVALPAELEATSDTEIVRTRWNILSSSSTVYSAVHIENCACSQGVDMPHNHVGANS